MSKYLVREKLTSEYGDALVSSEYGNTSEK